MRLIYKDSALKDIDVIVRYISERNPPAAIRLGQGILETCRLFKSHPEIGMRRDDLANGIRQFSHRGYGLYYQVDAIFKVIYVVRVLHPRINVKPELFKAP